LDHSSAPHIAVIGSLNMDVVVEAERPPKMGETVSGQKVHFLPGGKGANQAVALARLGARVSMIGSVGRDAFGDELKRALMMEGMTLDALKTVEEVATGTAHILIAQGDNQILVVPGANDHCLPCDIALHEEMIAQADAVLLQLEIPLETVCCAAEVAKKHRKLVILNPAPARKLPDKALQNIDVITPNQFELGLLAEMEWTGTDGIGPAMEKLLNGGIGQVVVTLGAKGAAFLERGKTLRAIPGIQTPVVDTTGAGDAFNAGLAYALATKKSLADAVRFAVQVSALSVTKMGAQKGMPTLDEVRAFFRSGQADEGTLLKIFRPEREDGT
jgi:ribokinase